jgi:hypothetical protein
MSFIVQSGKFGTNPYEKMDWLLVGNFTDAPENMVIHVALNMNMHMNFSANEEKFTPGDTGTVCCWRQLRARHTFNHWQSFTCWQNGAIFEAGS